MAKENTVFLYGRVSRNVVKVDEEGNLKSSKIMLETARRSFMKENFIITGQVRWDILCVYSRNEYTIRTQMMDVHQGDIIFVKGSLCTQDASRKFICPKCGNVQIIPSAVVVYIDPVQVLKVHEGFTDAEYQALLDKGMDEEAIRKKYPDICTATSARKALEDSREIGNQIFIDGTLCREPLITDFYHDDKKNVDHFQFQIASSRARRIKEDPVDKKTDFPWVKYYGKYAREYADSLHKGSSVFIDGAIQTREVTVTAQCPDCRALMEKKIYATEIVPYHVEYLHNCGQEFTPVEGFDTYREEG